MMQEVLLGDPAFHPYILHVCVIKIPKWPEANLRFQFSGTIIVLPGGNVPSFHSKDNKNPELSEREADRRHSGEGESHHGHFHPYL